MVNIGEFNPKGQAPMRPRDPIPAGWYGMQAVATDVRKNQKGTGQFLEVVFEPLEQMHPDLIGRQVFVCLNLWHDKQQTVDIAKSQLTSICDAIGIDSMFTDSDVLLHKPLSVKIKVRPASTDGKYGESNDVTAYDALGARFQSGAPVSRKSNTAPTARPPTPPQAAPQAGGAPPWAK